jgi:ligand-binding sensor domain-containing protein/signal transduction histidine kinase
MRRTLRSLALVVTLLVPCPVAGQDASTIAGSFIRQAWGSAQGLPQNSVTAILQTRDGYLWLGTFGGLVRFDGRAFTVFDSTNTPGLSSARIVSLYEDRSGLLWIGTEYGLVRYESGRFTSYSTRDGLPSNGVRSLMEDGRGRLWIGTGAEPARFERGRFTTVKTARPGEAALAFAETPNGDVWVSTGTGLERYANGDTPTQIVPAGRAVNQALTLLLDRKGRLWAGSNVLRRWDGSTFVEVPLGIAPARYGVIRAMAEDADGALWLGTSGGGVLRWREGVIDVYNEAAGLTSNIVSSLHVDREGNVWIGTDVGGLNRLKRRPVFSYQRSGFGQQSIGPIVGDGADGLLIGGTCGGLLHFRDGTLRPHEYAKLLHYCIWSLHRDPDGTLWVGSSGGGLARVRDGQVRTYALRDGLPDMMVFAITRDRDGSLWVGTGRGLARLKDDRFTTFGPAQGMQAAVKCITQDRSGALWIGGLQGLTRFKDGRATTFTTAQGLAHDLVRDVYEDADGVLWIGTYGGGLNRFKDGRFTAYGIKDGLHDNAVSRIIEDDRGNLWMSGNKGVYRVARRQLNDFAEGRIGQITSVSYGTADGMVIDETNGGQPAGWRTSDGRMWFPTIKGLVGIEPAGSRPPPPLFLERTIVQGRALEPGALPALGPGAIDTQFHYTAIDLSSGEKTRFRYRLEGYDTEWIEAGARRVAYYTKIPPGRYHFAMMATDGDGVWSQSPLRVPLVVRPLWWQRTGVTAGAVLLLMVTTGLAVREFTLRLARRRMRELEREHALNRERARIARDLHDDLGSRLAHIALMADANGDPGPVAAAAREAMKTMDELVWWVNARNDTVENFSQYASEFVQEQAVLAGLRCRLEIAPDLGDAAMTADARRHLYLALKEALHNVVKHAGASEVMVALHVAAGMLILTVADNGRGMSGAGVATGNGLRNIRERMTAVGGDVAIESEPGAGCRLTFTVPLPQVT